MNETQRIVIIGSTSSGKSTLAEEIARILESELIDLDALHWEPNWMEAPDEVFRARTDAATRASAWVLAGNYHQVRDIVWPRAQLIIWLDYSLPLVFWRLLTRTLRRTYYREKLYSGNVEKMSTHLKLWTQESIFHWLFKTYWRRRREYPQQFALPEHHHLRVLRFRRQRDTDRWLAHLTGVETTRSIEQGRPAQGSPGTPPTQT